MIPKTSIFEYVCLDFAWNSVYCYKLNANIFNEHSFDGKSSFNLGRCLWIDLQKNQKFCHRTSQYDTIMLDWQNWNPNVKDFRELKDDIQPYYLESKYLYALEITYICGFSTLCFVQKLTALSILTQSRWKALVPNISLVRSAFLDTFVWKKIYLLHI